MALSAASVQAIKELRRQIIAQIGTLQTTKQEHQDAIASINGRLAALRAQKDALTADLPEVTD